MTFFARLARLINLAPGTMCALMVVLQICHSCLYLCCPDRPLLGESSIQNLGSSAVETCFVPVRASASLPSGSTDIAELMLAKATAMTRISACKSHLGDTYVM